jgi:hypothetical protein
MEKSQAISDLVRFKRTCDELTSEIRENGEVINKRKVDSLVAGIRMVGDWWRGLSNSDRASSIEFVRQLQVTQDALLMALAEIDQALAKETRFNAVGGPRKDAARAVPAVFKRVGAAFNA